MTIAPLPSPLLMDMTRWAAQVRDVYPQAASILRDESGWRTWAATLANLPPFHVYNMPDPYGFPTFRGWAVAFTRGYPGGFA